MFIVTVDFHRADFHNKSIYLQARPINLDNAKQNK